VSRPHHLNSQLVLVVAIGGAIGTAGRHALGEWVPAEGGIPLGTLIANLAGAFVLGVLLELLIRAGRETPGRRVLRLGLGTGVMGGFTTYSSFALEVEKMLQGGRVGLAFTYGLGTVVLGFALCFAGIVLSERHHHRLVFLVPRDPDAVDIGPAVVAPQVGVEGDDDRDRAERGADGDGGAR
jgi:CrcB protein